MNLGVLWHSMEFPINKILLLSIEIIFCCWNHWNQYFMWHIYSSIYCLIKFIYLAVPPIAVIITALTWYLEIDLSYWFQMWQRQATSKISSLHCLHNAWYIHVIAEWVWQILFSNKVANHTDSTKDVFLINFLKIFRTAILQNISWEKQPEGLQLH